MKVLTVLINNKKYAIDIEYGELHRLTKLKSVLPTVKLCNKVFLVSTTIAQDPRVLRLTLMSASVDFGCPSHIYFFT